MALHAKAKAEAGYRFYALYDKITVHTVQLKAALDLSPGWTLAPAVGRTRSDEYGGVNFGALSVTHAW